MLRAAATTWAPSSTSVRVTASTDALAGAGHDGDLVGQPEIHHCLLLLAGRGWDRLVAAGAVTHDATADRPPARCSFRARLLVVVAMVP